MLYIKNRLISKNNNLIIIKKGQNETQLINELNKLNIKVTYLEWMIIKKIFNSNLSIKSSSSDE